MKCLRYLVLFSFVFRAWAEVPGVISGSVFDQSGAAIPGATITVSGPNGTAQQTATSGKDGSFSIGPLPSGKYDLLVASELFEKERLSVEVREEENIKPLRLTLSVAAVTDSVVVTATRAESKLSETPQEIELISSTDVQRSAAVDVTDLLKKNSGVDVIQYNSMLSGIGIRGFSPEFAGFNKHSVLLIDGRPSGATNLASVMLGDVDHIEVVKGPASSLYGASAMGGVVNIITKRSGGPLFAKFDLGAANFGTSDIGANFGGRVSSRFDFDGSFKFFDQRNDYRVGSGVDKRAGYEVEPNAVMKYSSYGNNDGSLRLGFILSPKWTVNARGNLFSARDVLNPGDIYFEGAQNSKRDFERATYDVRLQGQAGQHVISATGYTSYEHNNQIRVTSTNPAERPYLPFLSFEGFIKWKGAQVQDVWSWRKNSNLILGFDYELVTNPSRRFLATGARTGPFSADNDKRTAGLYAENTWSFKNGATAISAGGRIDNIKIETFDTPFKTGFTPSAASFTVFNPSFGIKQLIARGLRAHGTVGRAFVPANASALTGYNEGIVGGRTQITQGNPDLKPERSFTFDAGLEWTSRSTRIDVTYFQTKVDDRIISNVVISNPPPPEPVIVSFANAFEARMRGADIDIEQRFNRHVSVFGSATRYFTRNEQISATSFRTILVVASYSARAGVDFDWGRFTSRLSGRYVRGRYDLDFNTAGNPLIPYENFATVDLNAVYRIRDRQTLSITVNNLFDKYYYEKLGFPLAGRAIALRYGFTIGGGDSVR